MLSTWSELPEKRPTFAALAAEFWILLEDNENDYEREYTKDIPEDYYTEGASRAENGYIIMLEHDNSPATSDVAPRFETSQETAHLLRRNQDSSGGEGTVVSPSAVDEPRSEAVTTSL